jgi:hypothetical protein
MNARTTATIVAALVGIAASGLGPSGAAAACRAGVLSATLAARQLGCHAAVVATPRPVDEACLAAAATDFETGAGCVAPDAIDRLRTAAQTFVAEVSAVVAGSATPAGRRCAVKKLRVLGRAARGALRCQQQALGRVAFPIGSCRERAAEALTASWAALERFADCPTDDLELHERDLRDFVVDVGAEFAVDASPYVGTYDVEFFDPGPFEPGDRRVGMGAATVMSDGKLRLEVYLNGYYELYVEGWLSDDEVYIGESFAAFASGDAVAPGVVGQLAVSRTDDVHIVGSAEVRDDADNPIGTVRFILTRPISGTPSALGGAWLFGFEDGPSGCSCSSVSTLDLTVPADGFATSAPATDALPDDTVLGTFAAGSCQVSPGGVLRCRIPYDPVAETGGTAQCAQLFGGTCPIYLNGTLLPLPPDTVGRGGLFVGFLPPSFGTGWFVVAR